MAIGVGLALSIAAATAVLESYEVVGSAPFLSDLGEPVLRVRLFDKFDLFVEPAYRLTRAAVSAFFLTGIAFAALTFGLGVRRINEGKWTDPAWFFLIIAAASTWLAFDEFFALRATIGHNAPLLSAIPLFTARSQVIGAVYLLVGLGIGWWYRAIWAGPRSTRLLLLGGTGSALLAILVRGAPVLSTPVTVLAWVLVTTAVIRTGVRQLGLAASPGDRKPSGKRRGPTIGIRRWGVPPPSSRTPHSPWRT